MSTLWKPKSWFTPRGIVRLMILSEPQFEMSTGIGAMKSFNSDVNELPDERLFRDAAPKCSHTLVGKMFESVRLMPTSPNVELTPFLVLPSRVRGLPGGLVSNAGALLTDASAKAPRSTALFQHGSVLFASQSVAALPLVIHVCFAMTGPPLPPKSKSKRRSPAVRTFVTPLPAAVDL